MVTFTKDQHFVPQSYLQLFSVDQKGIWVCCLNDCRIRPQAIKDTGFIKWFYRSKIHAAPLDTPDVSSLEGKAKQIIKKIEKRENLTGEEFGKLLNFVILQFLRTPAARKRVEDSFQSFWNELKARYKKAGAKDKLKIEEIAESYLKDQNKKVAVKSFLENNIYFEAPQEFFSQSIPALGQKFMSRLAEQGFEFLSAEEEEFITSDDPFLFIVDDMALGTKIGKETYKIIPLSKKICMVIGGDKRPFIVKKMLSWAVKVINLNIANSSDRFFYGSNENLLKEILRDLPKFKSDPDSFTKL